MNHRLPRVSTGAICLRWTPGLLNPPFPTPPRRACVHYCPRPRGLARPWASPLSCAAPTRRCWESPPPRRQIRGQEERQVRALPACMTPLSLRTPCPGHGTNKEGSTSPTAASSTLSLPFYRRHVPFFHSMLRVTDSLAASPSSLPTRQSTCRLGESSPYHGDDQGLDKGPTSSTLEARAWTRQPTLWPRLRRRSLGQRRGGKPGGHPLPPPPHLLGETHMGCETKKVRPWWF